MNSNNKVHSLITHYEVLCKKAMDEYEQARAKMLKPRKVERFEDKVYFQQEGRSLESVEEEIENRNARLGLDKTRNEESGRYKTNSKLDKSEEAKYKRDKNAKLAEDKSDIEVPKYKRDKNVNEESNEDANPNKLEESTKNEEELHIIEDARKEALMMLEQYEDIIGDDSESSSEASEEYEEEDSNSEGAYYMGADQAEVQDDYEEPQHLNEDNLYDFIKKKEVREVVKRMSSLDVEFYRDSTIAKQDLENHRIQEESEPPIYDFVVKKERSNQQEDGGGQEEYLSTNQAPPIKQNQNWNQQEDYESSDDLYDFVKPRQNERESSNYDYEENEENYYDFVVKPAGLKNVSADETYDFVTYSNNEESEDESSQLYDFVVRGKSAQRKGEEHKETHFLEARNRAGKISRSEYNNYTKNEDQDTCDSANYDTSIEDSTADYGNLRGEYQEECEDYAESELIEDNNNNVCVLKEDREAVRYFFFNSEEADFNESANLQHMYKEDLYKKQDLYENLKQEDLYENLQQEFLSENLAEHLYAKVPPEDLYEDLQQEFLNENLGENCEYERPKFYKNLPSPKVEKRNQNGGAANKCNKKIRRISSFVSYISEENNEDQSEETTTKNKKKVRYADEVTERKTIKSRQYQDKTEVERRLVWNENQRKKYYDTPRFHKTQKSKVDPLDGRETKKATVEDCEACKKTEQIFVKKNDEEGSADVNSRSNEAENENMETKMIKSVNQQRPLEENIAKNKPVHEKSIFVMDELIKTEEEYLKTMNFVLKHYMLYLSRLYKECSMSKFKNVFGNMDKIYEDTLGFLTDIIHCRYDYEKVGQTFLQYKEMFGKYPFYCKNRNLSHTLVVGEFKSFITKRQVELNDKLGLNSHLQTPVQRLVRYEMLLKSLQKSLKDSSINTKTLEDAIKLIQHVAQKGNDMVSIEPIGFSPFSIKKTGPFLMKDSFKLVSPHREDVVLFLYKKMIVLAVENAKNVDGFNYRTSISMDSLAKIADDVSLYITLQNYDKRNISPAFILKARDMELKRKWVVRLDEILWAQLEHFRDMAKSNKQAEVPAIPIKNESKISTSLKRSEPIRRSNRDEGPIKGESQNQNRKNSSNKDYNSS